MKCECACCAEAAARLRADRDHRGACTCQDHISLEWCDCSFCNSVLRAKGLVG